MQEKLPINEAIKRQMSVRLRMLLRRLRRYLVTGVLVTAPIAITLYLAYLFVTFIDQNVAGMLPASMQPLPGHRIFPGSGIVISVLFFIIVGALAANILGQVFINISEYIMTHMPFMRTLYNAVKQIVETLLGSQAKAFREVVMIEFPRKGAWTIGFVTGVPEGEILENCVNGEELVTVFVPTAPSPVNGFMLFVPKKEVTTLKMSVDEGIKMVMSMGILAPTVPQPGGASPVTGK